MKMKKYSLLILIPLFTFGCNGITSIENEPLFIAEQYVKAVEAMDYEAMGNLLSDDYIGYGPSAEDSIRKEAALEKWQYNAENLYQKIEYLRSQFAAISIKDGEHKGEWVANWAELKIEYKDGRGPILIWANSNYKIENGKIVKSLTFYNEADVLRQLGYVFINPNDL
jgi:hypothetical protein